VAPNIPTPEVSRALKKIKGIDVIYEITGEYDIATVIVGSNIAELNQTIDEIRKLSGVADTNTVVVLKVIR
jgi:DNA-binding Lrp family transcriptional regulator